MCAFLKRDYVKFKKEKRKKVCSYTKIDTNFCTD